jgi:hypothetical protein
MKRFFEWHRELANDIADQLGLSAYQMFWISFVKGLIIGCLIGLWL